MSQRTAFNRMMAGSVLAVVLAGAAHAQEISLRPLLGAGLTAGGDAFIKGIEYDDGYSEDIRAGQYLQFYGGVRYQGVPQFSIQATIGYHVDDTRRADNGSAKFVRYPLEVLAHFHLDDQLRLGGGVRFVNGAKFTSSGVLAGAGDRTFENTVGTVVEGEYLLDPHFGLKLRAVSEKYEAKLPFNDSINGSHVGIFLNWYL